MKITTLALTRRYPVDLVQVVRDLLRRVPAEHVVGISRITLSGARPLDEASGEEVLGQYFEACDGEPAFIMLYPEEIAGEVPFLLRRSALAWRVLLAETLYHEVGHHYQRFTHGIRKTAQEDHAEGYGLRHARRVFPRVYRVLDGWRRVRAGLRRLRLAALELRRGMGLASAAELYEMGRLYWEAESWGRVVEAWEAALARDPGHVAAREWLPRARRRLRLEARRRAAQGWARPASPRRRSGSRRRRRVR